MPRRAPLMTTCSVYTSRTLFQGRRCWRPRARSPTPVNTVVRLALDAEPGWVIAKGGITSHDVAVHGLGIRRADGARPAAARDDLACSAPDRGRPGRDRHAVRRLRGQRRRRDNTLAEIVEKVSAEADAGDRFTDLLRRDGSLWFGDHDLHARVHAGDRARRRAVPSSRCCSRWARARTPRSGASRLPRRRSRRPTPPRCPRRHPPRPLPRPVEEIKACVALGYSSVMIDGSHETFEDNVAVTRESSSRSRAPRASGWRPSSGR